LIAQIKPVKYKTDTVKNALFAANQISWVNPMDEFMN